MNRQIQILKCGRDGVYVRYEEISMLKYLKNQEVSFSQESQKFIHINICVHLIYF